MASIENSLTAKNSPLYNQSDDLHQDIYYPSLLQLFWKLERKIHFKERREEHGLDSIGIVPLIWFPSSSQQIQIRGSAWIRASRVAELIPFPEMGAIAGSEPEDCWSN